MRSNEIKALKVMQSSKTEKKKGIPHQGTAKQTPSSKQDCR